MDFLGLQGRRVLVTGASSGIGRAVAIEASRHGAVVALSGRDQRELQLTASALVGVGHVVVSGDLLDPAAPAAIVDQTADALGGIDAVVHAAGTHSFTPLRSVEAETVNAAMALNVTAAVLIAQAFRRKQIAKTSPSLVLLSSAVGLVGQAGVSVYSASKGAVVSLTKSLALELVRDGIRVNCVCPGVVETPMTEAIRDTVGQAGFDAISKAHPLGVGTADDVANAILFLISDRSRWITGTSLVVDGGYTAQ